MIFFRIIPILLIENQNCIKTIKFKKKIYLGDPINIVKIYSELGVDEILINDISNSDIPDFKLLKQISEESFVPLSYGGGVKSFNDIEKILSYGYEKICFNSLVFKKFEFIEKAIKEFGNSSISISVNLKKNFIKKLRLFNNKKKSFYNDTIENHLEKINMLNPSETLLTFVDLEGTRSGYDKELISKYSKIIKTNLIINGGAKKIDDFIFLKNLDISGGVASSLFSFKGNNESVLVNYLSNEEIEKINS
jgi:imidazole glycerol-phosphate synthase subunit HisF